MVDAYLSVVPVTQTRLVSEKTLRREQLSAARSFRLNFTSGAQAFRKAAMAAHRVKLQLLSGENPTPPKPGVLLAAQLAED